MVVVEDDPICAAATARALGRSFEIITIEAQSERAALRAVGAQREVDGFVVDVRLGRDHGAGLAVVELAARRFAGAPILVMSSYLEHHPINFSHRHGAAFAAKKLSREDLQAFAARVVSSRLGNPLVAEHVARRGRAWKLSPIEVEVLHWATLGRPRETYLERKDITIHAWKKHVRAIIHKKARAEVRDAPTLEAIVATILRDMVIPAPPPVSLSRS